MWIVDDHQRTTHRSIGTRAERHDLKGDVLTICRDQESRELLTHHFRPAAPTHDRGLVEQDVKNQRVCFDKSLLSSETSTDHRLDVEIRPLDRSARVHQRSGVALGLEHARMIDVSMRRNCRPYRPEPPTVCPECALAFVRIVFPFSPWRSAGHERRTRCPRRQRWPWFRPSRPK